MSNSTPPFSIGQEVVCVKVIDDYDPDVLYRLVKGKHYVIETIHPHMWKTGMWAVGLKENPDKFDRYAHYQFAPIQTEYSDARFEIMEKFKSPQETPDKIIAPEKVETN